VTATCGSALRARLCTLSAEEPEQVELFRSDRVHRRTGHVEDGSRVGQPSASTTESTIVLSPSSNVPSWRICSSVAGFGSVFMVYARILQDDPCRTEAIDKMIAEG